MPKQAKPSTLLTEELKGTGDDSQTSQFDDLGETLKGSQGTSLAREAVEKAEVSFGHKTMSLPTSKEKARAISTTALERAMEGCPFTKRQTQKEEMAKS